MAKRRKWRKHTVETKIAAVEEVNSGARPSAVAVKYDIVNGLLATWRKQHAAGALAKKLNGHAAAKPAAKGATAKTKEHLPPSSAGMTPEVVFGSRVQKAIITLRQAQEQVEEMKRQGKIKEADTAHLLAELALRYLQGDYGR